MWASQRLNEPSTYAGLAGILQGLKMLMPPQWHVWLDAATMAAGSVAAVKADPARK